jgi:hypothetical protein
LGKFWQGLGMENVVIFYDLLGIFYGHLALCLAVWYSFVVICFFPILVCLDQEKSGSRGSFQAESSSDQNLQSGSWGPYNRQTYWSYHPTIERPVERTFQVFTFIMCLLIVSMLAPIAKMFRRRRKSFNNFFCN